MVERKPPLAGLEATKGRHVNARPARNLFECEAALHTQVAQATPHPHIDAVFVICLHGKKAWHY